MFKIIKKSFTFFLIELLLLQSFEFTYADTITGIDYLTPDGSTATYTDRAVNNTPIVNIAAPNSSGVSLNNWTKYNVTSENQILNNYKGGTVDTSLGGIIYGNPNFIPPGASQARVIVNQVTSSNRSDIGGYIEIAGGRADLVIANPNGMNISGAGFINTGRLSLVSGLVNLNSGTGVVDNFTLGVGANSNIIITGINTPTYANLGLDASTVDYVDIISRAVVVLGDIHAKNHLDFKLGNKTYNYEAKTISSDVGILNAPSFALDSNYLGGMYANKIILVASEAGLGVRARGDLVSSVEDVDFNVMGDVDYERISSNRDIIITSNLGKITQGKYTSLSRPALSYALGDISLDGATGIELNGNYVYAGNSLFLTDGVLIKNNTSLQITNDIIALGNAFENNSLMQAGRDISLTLEGNLIDASAIKAGRDLIVDAKTGITYNDILAVRNISILNRNSGNIIQTRALDATGTASIINNAGNITLGGDSVFSNLNLTLNASGNITNNADVLSNQNISLTNTGTFTNNTQLRAVGNITDNSGSFRNNALLQAGIDVSLTLNEDLIDTSSIKAGRDLTIDAKTGVTYRDILAVRNISILNRN